MRMKNSGFVMMVHEGRICGQGLTGRVPVTRFNRIEEYMKGGRGGDACVKNRKCMNMNNWRFVCHGHLLKGSTCMVSEVKIGSLVS